MELKKLIELQREFDSKHKSNFKWDEEVTNENIQILANLVLSLAGETGELANLVKKTVRGDFDLSIARHEISEELADIFIYLMKISYQMNINLEEAFLLKLDKNKKRFIRFSNSSKESE